jgi:ornithine carbamoyltransferase
MKESGMKGRSLLTLAEYTEAEIRSLLKLAASLKAKKRGEVHPDHLKGRLLEGKNIVLIFDKSSTRTRCSFEVAAFDEGANVTFLTNSQMGVKESVEDTARVLGRFYDGIQYRGYSTEVIQQLARYSGVPVWNGLTDDDHPTQVLADVMTAVEHSGKDPADLVFTYVGDGRNNVSNALLIGAVRLGYEYRIAAPDLLWPSEELLRWAKEEGGQITVTEDAVQAVEHTDVIYTDVWFSMGEEEKAAERIGLLEPYRVTMELLNASKNPKVLFEHCLPAFHDLKTEIMASLAEPLNLTEMEVTDEVFRSRHSVVFDQAENRMHTIKAVLVATLTGIL